MILFGILNCLIHFISELDDSQSLAVISQRFIGIHRSPLGLQKRPFCKEDLQGGWYIHHMIEFDVEFSSYTCRYGIHVFWYYKCFAVAKQNKNQIAWIVEIYWEMQKRLVVSVQCFQLFGTESSGFCFKKNQCKVINKPIC